MTQPLRNLHIGSAWPLQLSKVVNLVLSILTSHSYRAKSTLAEAALLRIERQYHVWRIPTGLVRVLSSVCRRVVVVFMRWNTIGYQQPFPLPIHIENFLVVNRSKTFSALTFNYTTLASSRRASLATKSCSLWSSLSSRASWSSTLANSLLGLLSRSFH